MKVAICAVIRLENRYLQDFVNHYKKIGFDKIILCDNNFDNEENLLDVISNEVNEGFIDILNYKNRKEFQGYAYNDVIQLYKNEYDWIAFFDIDEYLILLKDNNIKDYINRFNSNIDSIYFNWKVFDDNNLIYYENKPLYIRFTTPIANDITFTAAPIPENYHLKVMVNVKNNPNAKFTLNPHFIINSKNAIYEDGTKKANDFNYYNKPTYKYAQLNHYMTKTIEEYCWKVKRGRADINNLKYNKEFINKHFFKINKRTKEKENYINSLFKNKN